MSTAGKARLRSDMAGECLEPEPPIDGLTNESEFCVVGSPSPGDEPSWLLPVEGPFALLPGTRLWIFDSGSASEGDRCPELCVNELTPEDQERYVRYRSEKKRREFLISRTVIASVLRKEFGRDSTEIRMFRDPLSGCLSLRTIGQEDVATFSLTHSGRITAVVLGEAGVSVGVDLEAGSFSGAVDRLSQLTLSDRERVWFDALPSGIRRECLQQTWTVKESIWKTFGTRMGTDLRAIETTAAGKQSISGTLISKPDEDLAVQWQVQCFSGSSGIDTYCGIQKLMNRNLNRVDFCGAVSRVVQGTEICTAW
ncbi:MAG: 4'-phosphopantetheinyl transferase family protein [Planctomyces sp.]|jgi:phosphopantetheinyl transferase